MPYISTTLDNFFGAREFPQKHLPSLVNSKDFKPLKKSISKKIKSPAMPDGFWEKMFSQLYETLKIDAKAILISAWTSSGVLDKFLDSSKYPPDEIVLLPMSEHSIISNHKPSLKPSINNMPVGEIKFNVNLELLLQGVILKIKDGWIKELDIGSCQARGSIAYGDYPILKKEGQFPELIGSINIGKGINIKQSVDKVHESMKIIDKSQEEEIASA